LPVWLRSSHDQCSAAWSTRPSMSASLDGKWYISPGLVIPACKATDSSEIVTPCTESWDSARVFAAVRILSLALVAMVATLPTGWLSMPAREPPAGPAPFPPVESPARERDGAQRRAVRLPPKQTAHA